MSRIALSDDASGAGTDSRTAALIEAAASLVVRTGPDGTDMAAFVAIYRDWILEHRNLRQDRARWAERHAVLLHLMTSASTVGESLDKLSRFSGVVWGEAIAIRFELRPDGSGRLMIDEAGSDSPVGEISALWLVSILFVQLEFLVGHKLEYLPCSLPNRRHLPAEIQPIFYGGTVDYGAREIAIELPESVLHLPVTASAGDISGFLESLMVRSISASRSYETYRRVYNLIWHNVTRSAGSDIGMAAVARQLGSNPATVRRQLRNEGHTFKAIKADIRNRIASRWIRNTSLSVEDIADRLGYSCTFAFRRAFHQSNGLSPSEYRKLSHGDQAGFRRVSDP